MPLKASSRLESRLIQYIYIYIIYIHMYTMHTSWPGFKVGTKLGGHPEVRSGRRCLPTCSRRSKLSRRPRIRTAQRKHLQMTQICLIFAVGDGDFGHEPELLPLFSREGSGFVVVGGWVTPPLACMVCHSDTAGVSSI